MKNGHLAMIIGLTIAVIIICTLLGYMILYDIRIKW